MDLIIFIIIACIIGVGFFAGLKASLCFMIMFLLSGYQDSI